jgi:hypothetical protein
VPVSVRFRTEDRSAIAGEDYTAQAGELVFAPGEISKIVSIPLVDDGPGDADESFVVVLADADGAKVRGDLHEVWMDEEDGPVRLRLTETLIEVDEGAGVVTGTVEIDRIHTEVVYGIVDAFDDSAFVASDYKGMPAENGAPWASFEIPIGSTSATFQFEIINDDIAEQDETFWIQATPFDLVFPGQPVVGLIQVIDDDGGGGDP